jgi:pimeloyl-ACP methyl ester carboxylesterase
MTTLKVPGRRDELRISPDAGTGRFMEARVVERVRVEPLRSATDVPVELELADDDIVELILEDGLRQWVSFAQLRADMGERLERSGTPGELVLPTRLSIGSPARGAADWAIEGLRVLRVDLPGETAHAIARRFENQLEQPGLCRWRPGEGRLAPVTEGIPADRPVLLFLHGTASRTTASFGGLTLPAQEDVRRQLLELYGDHIYAFEHRTLSESPIENAIELLEALPANVRLHVVSHSRGGLVGELLCRASLDGRPPFDELDFGVFDKHPATGRLENPDRDKSEERHPDRKNLEKLGKLLESKRPRVERFVRVACPAAGTTLASRRLDRYLSVLVNLVGLIPALKASPVYDFVTSFLLAVVKQRTDPSELPGLEAQMPESALVRVLNRPDVRIAASDLCVISGDIEGGGIFQRLGILATDAFYCEDHDLVVNTRAMYGGAARTNRPRFLFDRGPRVHHFSYFENARSTAAILAGLTGAPGHGLEELIEETGELPPDRFASRSAVPLPTVFVLPGIMGSHLEADGNRIWLDPFDIALGRMSRLKMDAADVKPVRLVGLAYDDFCAFLADSHEVVAFPYDWRMSLLDEAERLATHIEERLNITTLPVHIVAHSMGGLLARTMIAQRPDLWERIRERGGRLIMLGTPNGGSWVIPRVLLGRETVLRQLSMLDLKHDRRELLEIISRFRGLLELLPARAAGEPDFFGADIWKEFEGAERDGWVRPDDSDLGDVLEFRKVIDNGPVDVKHMLYVAGAAPETPIGYELVEKKKGQQELRFIGTTRGDGRVPWSTGPLPGLKLWYMPAGHGEMAAHKPSFAALLDLLESGDTARLSTTPILTRGVARSAAAGVGDTFPLPEIDPQRFPDRKDLEAAAIGWEPELEAEPVARRVRVTIAHGNLAFARHPVAVGHYAGDTIVSAEGALDYYLDGRLTERHRIGLYPGAIETAEVVLRCDDTRPAGAIVMGLGKVGRLSPGGLTATFANACVRYAATVRDRMCGVDGAGAEVELALTSLLIGSGESGLSLEDVIRSILRGVAIANERLADASPPVRIGEIELLELYKDRAVQSARVLQQLEQEGPFSDFTFPSEIRDLPGGRSRVFHAEDPSWWRPLQVEGGGNGDRRGIGLRFLAVADRAGAAVTNLASQRSLVDRLVAQAVGNPRRDRELAQAMFELLVPNSLKRQAPERRNLLLVLDDDAAQYPWELLEDPMLREPLSVTTGMIRQLMSDVPPGIVTSPTEARALVVGNPVTHLVALPGATAEAKRVAGLLSGQGGFTVDESIETGPDDVIRRLFSRNTDGLFGFRVLHLAGHGVFSDDPGGVTGMVIGRNTYLTPGDIAQLRQVPELVFLNCCYLGRVDDAAEAAANQHRLAANLGTQLIRMGVRVVVAAGWAVNDSAATTFAGAFYEAMLGGREFGDAVQRARETTYARHGSLNTWGAYQCYGDPGYRLRIADGGGRDGGNRYVDPAEVVADLLNIASDADAGASRDGTLKADLDAVLGAIPRKWLDRGDVSAALGEAYGQLDEFGSAVLHFTTASTAERALQPLRSIERLLNLEARHAVDVLQTMKVPPTAADRKQCEETLTRVIGRLEKLIDIADTAERWSVLGSAHKRLAAVSTRADRRTSALADAESAYRRAYELMLERRDVIDTYPLLNWLTLMAIRRWLDRWSAADGSVFREQIEQAESRAAEQDTETPSFFNAVSVGECILVRHLGEGDLGAHVDEVVDHYVRGWRRGASGRRLASVQEHLLTLIGLLGGTGKTSTSPKSKTRAELSAALDQIRARLESATSPASDR